jgi:arylsulfatase
MAAYAALIDRVDQEVGRLVADLERKGELENTIIIFLSDNGACPYDRRSQGRDQEPYRADTTWSDSTGWAWARNTPFRYYKQNQFEGGIATPAIVHWPAGLKRKPGGLIHTPAHLVDVLPTLAELGGAPIPATWPGRELTPLAGISLAPIFAGGEIEKRPPIHLLFSSDRGLRDGAWKLVSFQSEPWELYNIDADRTELHNVAAQYPEIVNRMSQQWHAMTEKVLMAPAKENTPVAVVPPAKAHVHREWTDFSTPDGSSRRHTSAKASGKTARKEQAEATPRGGKASIRARTGTQMEVSADQLVLTCTGDDPGLAFDALPALAAKGPYQLVFNVQSESAGEGEIYWTTQAEVPLPKGTRQAFPVRHDREWHPVSLRMETTEKLYAFRLDPCSAPGTVRIKDLQLRDASGNVLLQWPGDGQ